MTLQLIFVAATLLFMLVAIIFDWKLKIKNLSFSWYWLGLLIGAILCLIFGFVNLNDLSAIFISDASINPLKILIIFISLTLLSVLLDELGFFKHLAQLVLQKAKESQIKLFICFYLIISFLTVLTSNDIIILTFTPFICYFTKHAKIDPTPYIISEFVAANTWSTLLIIGNPTNIYLATSFDINFLTYLYTMALPAIASSLVSFLILFLIFYKKLKEPINIRERDAIPVKLDKTPVTIGLIGLSVCIVLMAISSYINIEMWYIPLICMLTTFITTLITCLIKKKSLIHLWNALKKAPYSLIPFLLSMAVIISVLNNCGFINIFSNFIEGQNVIVVGLVSFLLANIINNIPMTMFFASVFQSCAKTLPMIFSSIFASNICAFFTPLGALAGIMFLKILKRNKVKFSYLKFILYGSIVAIPTLLTGLLIINFI